jgi:hypothetical protein
MSPTADRGAFTGEPFGGAGTDPGRAARDDEDMLLLSRAPQGDIGSDDFLAIESIGALTHRICVALEHIQRGGARRMRCCEQRRRRARADARDKGRFGAAEIVEHGGDAVGPLLQGRQRAPA